MTIVRCPYKLVNLIFTSLSHLPRKITYINVNNLVIEKYFFGKRIFIMLLFNNDGLTILGYI